MKDSFASRMRKAMDIRDMKQAELVEKTGLGKSAISQYFSGKYEPK
jgi:transcriptional regulator with XRE-family HTH domain